MSDRLIVEIFAHLDAGDRTKWPGNQGERPLTELGRRQSELLCAEVAVDRVDALYSSPALRCSQSLDPLARQFGLTAKLLPGLHETDAWRPPEPWKSWPGENGVFAIGGAYAAGAAMRALGTIREERPTGRVAACTHGDVLPILVMYLAGAFGLEVPRVVGRGSRYTVIFDGDRIDLTQHDVPTDFPSLP